jgi:ketosteroid isomerase-like protein
MRSTKQVVDNHWNSFGKRDLEGILSDYAPEAVFFTPRGPLKGAGPIRELFVGLLAEFGKPGAKFSLDHLSVEGDHAYILWKAETADNVYQMITDTFIVRDGKIAVQSFAACVTPRPAG